MTGQVRFLGPIRRAPLSSFIVGEDLVWPIEQNGPRTVGYHATIRSFNAQRTEMTLFIHKTGETVVVEAHPDQLFDRL